MSYGRGNHFAASVRHGDHQRIGFVTDRVQQDLRTRFDVVDQIQSPDGKRFLQQIAEKRILRGFQTENGIRETALRAPDRKHRGKKVVFSASECARSAVNQQNASVGDILFHGADLRIRIVFGAA